MSSGLLGGTLNVSFINGFNPARGDNYYIVTTPFFGGITGTFFELERFCTPPNGLVLVPVYGNFGVTLVAADDLNLSSVVHTGNQIAFSYQSTAGSRQCDRIYGFTQSSELAPFATNAGDGNIKSVTNSTAASLRAGSIACGSSKLRNRFNKFQIFTGLSPLLRSGFTPISISGLKTYRPVVGTRETTITAKHKMNNTMKATMAIIMMLGASALAAKGQFHRKYRSPIEHWHKRSRTDLPLRIIHICRLTTTCAGFQAHLISIVGADPRSVIGVVPETTTLLAGALLFAAARHERPPGFAP
ncbi:MAG: hypothetical protein WDM80_09845 [Limisphaerales bacterium]